MTNPTPIMHAEFDDETKFGELLNPPIFFAKNV